MHVFSAIVAVNTQNVYLKLTAESYKENLCVGKPPTPQHYQDQGGQSDTFHVTVEVDSQS